jgi:AraC-like DNA-binding protein
LCQFAGDYGVRLTHCLTGTRITADMLTDPEAEIAASQELRLIANILDILGDVPGLGLQAGVRYRLTTYGIWGFAVLSSQTLRDAVSVGMKFIELTYACTDIAFHEGTDSVTLTFEDWDLPEAVRRFVLERDTAAAMAIFTETLNRPIGLRSLTLALPMPPNLEQFIETYDVEPTFDGQRTVASLDRALLDLPLPQASPITARLCEQQCRQLLQRRRARQGVSGRVRDLILHDPRRVRSQDDVAAALHVSTRTLRRQLADEDTTFRAVVEQTREQLAEELLKRDLTVEQVAYRLGYSEASSFVHAFTRWKAIAPRTWAQAQAR